MVKFMIRWLRRVVDVFHLVEVELAWMIFVKATQKNLLVLVLFELR